MKTDRELLEKAAKACFGKDALGNWKFEWNGVNQCIEYIPDGSVYYMKWRPNIDDGDAMRLAITLKMDIYYYPFGTEPYVSVHDKFNKFNGQSENFNNDSLAYEATRSAIVRCAAAIGEAMT